MHLCPAPGHVYGSVGLLGSIEQASLDECHCSGGTGTCSLHPTWTGPLPSQRHAPWDPIFSAQKEEGSPRVSWGGQESLPRAAEAKADHQARAPFRGARGEHICMTRHLCSCCCPRPRRGDRDLASLAPHPPWLAGLPQAFHPRNGQQEGGQERPPPPPCWGTGARNVSGEAPPQAISTGTVMGVGPAGSQGQLSPLPRPRGGKTDPEGNIQSP